MLLCSTKISVLKSHIPRFQSEPVSFEFFEWSDEHRQAFQRKSARQRTRELRRRSRRDERSRAGRRREYNMEEGASEKKTSHERKTASCMAVKQTSAALVSGNVCSCRSF
ncbi:hypothetical protein AOLI_G00150720 [Acnodon oligacanthus]